MLKKILPTVAAFFLAAGMLAGCTPKAASLWCYGLGEGAEFSLEYSVSRNFYDGQSRTFTVKDKEAFEAYLQTAEGFAGTCDLADAEGEAFLFFGGGNGYFCTENGVSENSYKLTPCSLMIESEGKTIVFAYPPTANSFVFAEDGAFEAARDWAYFSDFYSLVPNAEIDNESHSVVTDCYPGYDGKATGKVTLTYTEGAFAYTVSENE